MPIYSYKCDSCGKVFKKLQSINAEPLSKCEECGGVLVKQIGRVGIKFSGSGYYVTDSKKSSIQTSVPEKTAAPSEKKETKESTAKETTSTENSVA